MKVHKISCTGFLFPLFVFYLCSCSTQDQTQILFQTSKSNYLICFEASGVLEAKKSHSLFSPRVSGQPIISYLAPEGSKVKKDEIVVKFEAERIQQNYLNALEQLETAKAEADRKEAELNLQHLLYDSQIKSAEASLISSKLQLPKLEFEPSRVQEIKKLEITQQELQANRAKDKIESLKKIQKEDRLHYQLKIKQAENKVNRANTQLEQLIIKAPFDGLFIYETNLITGKKITQGDALFFGMPVAKLPDLSIMQAKFQIGETEAQKIQIGQKAEVIVPVLGDQIFNGKVSQVGSMAKPIKRGSKVKKVEITVVLDSVQQGLVPGLTANGKIQIEQVKEIVAVPLESVFENDSVKVVFEYKNKSYFPHAVAVYDTDEDFAIVMSDLVGGEDLALQRPNDSNIIWPDSLFAPKLPEKPKPKPKKKKPPMDPAQLELLKKQMLEKFKMKK